MSLIDDDMLIQLLMLEAGIVPFRPTSSHYLTSEESSIIDKRIASLEPEQRNAVKRKFRKLWRKAVKHFDEERVRDGLSPAYAQLAGLNCSEPTPSQKATRRNLVVSYLKKKRIF